MIIGVDEAGRGPLAGPVVAAAVVLCKPRPAGLDDSKKLSALRRGELEAIIKRRCRWAVGLADVEEIDRLNIFGATMLAMTRAVAALCSAHDAAVTEVRVDGNLTPHGRVADWCWTARAIGGGDATEPCISAASIIAKEHRDRMMRSYAIEHPHYGWAANKGYGAPEHLRALAAHGPTPLHRRSFAPVRNCRVSVEVRPQPAADNFAVDTAPLGVVGELIFANPRDAEILGFGVTKVEA